MTKDDVAYFKKKMCLALGLDKVSDEQVAAVTHDMRVADAKCRAQLGLLREAFWVYVKTRLLKRHGRH